jgi:hypothetical protein
MKYNFNDNRVQSCTFEDTFDFIGDLLDLMSNDEDELGFSVITKNHDLINDLLEVFLGLVIGGISTKIGMIEYEGHEMDYFNEYSFTLCDNIIWIEPTIAERDGKEIVLRSPDMKLLYIDNDCESRILTENMKCDSNVLCFDIGDDECDCCSGICEDFEDDSDIECDELNDDTNGFSYMESDENSDHRYSFYSSDRELVKEAMNRIVKSK